MTFDFVKFGGLKNTLEVIQKNVGIQNGINSNNI